MMYVWCAQVQAQSPAGFDQHVLGCWQQYISSPNGEQSVIYREVPAAPSPAGGGVESSPTTADNIDNVILVNSIVSSVHFIAQSKFIGAAVSSAACWSLEYIVDHAVELMALFLWDSRDSHKAGQDMI
jgi:hypothetical protein